MLDERRIETLQHVRVRLERQHQKLLNLPIRLLRSSDLELLRHAVERPVQFGRRQIDAAAVGVRVVIIQAIRPRADHAAIDHPVEQIAPRGVICASPISPSLYWASIIKIVRAAAALRPHPGSGPDRSDSDRPATGRSRPPSRVGAECDPLGVTLRNRNDLRADRENQVRVLMDSLSHVLCL